MLDEPRFLPTEESCSAASLSRKQKGLFIIIKGTQVHAMALLSLSTTIWVLGIKLRPLGF